jgi:hypothetical protein
LGFQLREEVIGAEVEYSNLTRASANKGELYEVRKTKNHQIINLDFLFVTKKSS